MLPQCSSEELKLIEIQNGRTLYWPLLGVHLDVPLLMFRRLNGSKKWKENYHDFDHSCVYWAYGDDPMKRNY